MGPFDAGRLATAMLAVTEIEQAVKFHLETSDSPAELARGWEAYRGAVSLRKALGRWDEMRRWRSAHAED